MLKSTIVSNLPIQVTVDPMDPTVYDVRYILGLNINKRLALISVLDEHSILISNNNNSPIYIEGSPIRINLQYTQTLIITDEWKGTVSYPLWDDKGTGSFEIQVTKV